MHAYEYCQQGDLRLVKRIRQPSYDPEWVPLTVKLFVCSGDLFHIRSANVSDETWRFETWRFEIHKFQPMSKEKVPWSRVYNLGDRSLFQGLNDPIFMAVKEFPWCKPNCIYFTNERNCNRHDDFDWDCGVYSLEENRVIAKYPLPFGDAPTIWYRPKLLTMDPNTESELLEQETGKKLKLLKLHSDQDSSSDSSHQSNFASSKCKNSGKSVEFGSAPSSKPVRTNKTASLAFLEDMNAICHNEFVILKCKDGEMVPVPVQQAVQSSYVRHLLESGIKENIVLCENLSKNVLEMLMEYWSMDVGDAFCDEDKVKEIDDPEYEFFRRIGPNNLYELLMGSSYVDAWVCVEHAGEFCASYIRNKSIFEIRNYFSLKKGFTQEEDENLKKDWPWACVKED